MQRERARTALRCEREHAPPQLSARARLPSGGILEDTSPRRVARASPLRSLVGGRGRDARGLRQSHVVRLRVPPALREAALRVHPEAANETRAVAHGAYHSSAIWTSPVSARRKNVAALPADVVKVIECDLIVYLPETVQPPSHDFGQNS